MRRVIVYVTCLLIQLGVSAQPVSAQVFREYDHQPEVWHHPGPIASNVDAGGNLSLSIPVLKVPGRGLDFDVNFSYQAGIRVQQRASWIGLGWNFDPGSITRDVQGAVVRPYSSPEPGRVHTPTVYYDVDFAGTDAYLPDAYYVHLPEGTYSMMRTGDGGFSSPSPTAQSSRFYVEEWKNWKIDPSSATVVTVDGMSTSSPDIPKFVITSEDGTRYVFEEKTISRHTSISASLIQYVDAWRLRAILAPDYSGTDIPSDNEAGSWVRFDYRHSSSRLAPKTMATQNQTTQTTYLHKIVTPTHTAEFFTDPRIDLEVFQSPDDYWASSAVEMYRNLKKIELKTRAGSLVRQVLLEQDASLVRTRFTEGAGQLSTSLQACAPPLGTGNNCAGRTTLKKVVFKDASGVELPGYGLDYVSLNPANPFVKNLSGVTVGWRGMDDYGYFNSVLTNAYTNPEIDADTTDARAWSLAKITYPNGGSESFEYQNDKIADSKIDYQYYFDFSDARNQGQPSPDQSRNAEYIFLTQGLSQIRQGGLRLLRKTARDAMGDSVVTGYNYGPGRSTGVPGEYFHKDLFVQNFYQQDGYVYNAPSARNASRVVYEWVERNVASNGLSRSYYTTNSSTGFSSSVKRLSTVLWAKHGIRGAILGNQDWNWGREYKSEIRNSGGQIVQSVDRDISFTTTVLDSAWNFKAAGTNYLNVNTYVVINWGYMRVNKETVRTYPASGGSSFAESVTEYTYDSATNFLRGTKARRYKAGNSTAFFATREIKYAHELSASQGGDYTTMRTKNMLRQVAQEDVAETTGGSASYLASTITTWKTPSGRSFVKPYRVYKWKASAPSGSLPAFTGWGSGTPSSSWLLTAQNESYDAHGNLTQVQDGGGRSTNLSYNSTYYDALLTSVSRGALSVAMTYDSSYGNLTQYTDENGQQRVYEYDSFGRLLRAKNDAGEVVAAYQYTNPTIGSGGVISQPARIRSTVYRSATDTTSTAQFFDGLARVIQTQVQESGTTAHISHTTYDEAGRSERQYKPYTAATGLAYQSGYHNNAAAYYDGSPGPQASGRPYTEAQYFGDPLERPKRTLAPGVTDGIGTEVDYNVGALGSHTFVYSETTDEEGRKAFEYKDAFGQTVLSRRRLNEYSDLARSLSGDAHSTYGDGTVVQTKTFYATHGHSATWAIDHNVAGTGNVVFSIYPSGSPGSALVSQTCPSQCSGTGAVVLQQGVTYVMSIQAATFKQGDYSESYVSVDYVERLPYTNVDTYFEYDGAGRLVKTTQPGGQATTYTFNTLGQLTQKTSPDAGTSKHLYDRYSNLRFTQDARQASQGKVHFTTYDAFNRPTYTGEASATWATLAADPDLTQTFETDANAWLSIAAYDAKPAGAPWSLFSGLSGISLTNTVGRLSATGQRSDGQWQLTFFSYDDEGRVTKQHVFTEGMTSNSALLSFTYNRQGQLTYRLLQNGTGSFPTNNWFYQWYSYDGRGLPSRVFASTSSTQPSFADLAYTYTPEGSIAQVKYGEMTPNTFALNMPYTYDARGRVTTIGDYNTWYRPFAQQNVYDRSGNVTQTTMYRYASSHMTRRMDYAYDGMSRLLSADHSSGTSTPYSVSSTLAHDLSGISYDKNGNLKTLTRRGATGSVIDGLTYHYASGTNRLTNYGDSGSAVEGAAEAQQINYDLLGNTEYMLLIRGDYKEYNFTYDNRNLPITARVVDYDAYTDVTTRYRYSYSGYRITKKIGGSSVEHYLLDGSVSLALQDGSSGSVAFYNILGPAGEVLGRWASGVKRYYVKDHLGSVRVTITPSGSSYTVVEYADFDAWGALLGKYQSGTSAKEGYTAKERDEETGLDYFGARYYMADIGRWLVLDPAAEKYAGYSPYNYVLANPMAHIDPDGREPAPINDYYFDSNGRYVTTVDKPGPDRVFLQNTDGSYRIYSFNDPQGDRARMESMIDAHGSDVVLVDRVPSEKWSRIMDYMLSGYNKDSDSKFLYAVRESDGGKLDMGPTLISEQRNSGIKPSHANINADKGRFYVFVGDNSIYNTMDAGNRFWGGAMARLGHTLSDAKLSAHLHQMLFKQMDDRRKQGLLDSEADQRAIDAGWNHD